MNPKENLTLVKNLFQEVFSGGKTEAMNKYFTDNVRLNDPAVPMFKGGLENFKKLETQYLRAFPDKKIKINDILATDNKVVVYWTCSATHNGPLAEYEATGNRVDINGITIYEFSSNGKIEAVDQLWDRLALLEQIGESTHLAVKS